MLQVILRWKFVSPLQAVGYDSETLFKRPQHYTETYCCSWGTLSLDVPSQFREGLMLGTRLLLRSCALVRCEGMILLEIRKTNTLGFSFLPTPGCMEAGRGRWCLVTEALSIRKHSTENWLSFN